MDSYTARRAEVSIIYEGVNITKDVAPYLLSFTYTDNASDKADDISFSLEDRERLWVNDWFPTKGDKIKATIILHNWEAPNQTQSLPCGMFEVDEISCSGPPNQITIKAVSTLVSKPMRQEKHTKAWENVSLKTIAGDIAGKNGLTLFWDSSEDPTFERRDQVETSDLEFFSGLARDYGVAVKVTDTQLVCYSSEEYETHSPVGELAFKDKKVISWSFSSKSAGTYKAAKVQYHDPVKDETFEAEEEDEDAEGSGRILEINQKADTLADAKKIAKEKLHSANKKEITGSITLMGDLRFVGGSNVKISGFGAFDGSYVIEKATHTVSGSYTTKLDLSMGKESKKAVKAKKAKPGSRKSTTTTATDTVENVYLGEKRVLIPNG